eukprot:635302-Karenia_brevis.AAC.1
MAHVKEIGIISNRILVLTLYGLSRSYHLINVYAPQNGCTETEKDTFYEDLQFLWDKYPNRDAKVIFGDQNARLHARYENEHNIIGPHYFGRGTAFLESRAEDDLDNRN